MLSLGQTEKKDQKFTPEQRATIKSKELALKLDLNESQETKLLDLMKTTWSSKPKRIKHENLSQDERYVLRIEYLNSQKEFQKELKKILTEDQFESWLQMSKKQMRKYRMKRFQKKWKETD
jgi:hypothetical protein